MKNPVLEVLVGLLVSGAIFLLLFVITLGAFVGYFQSTSPTPIWAGAFYMPYLVVGVVSLIRRWNAFGLTLLVSGIVAVVALSGFVYGLGGSF
jgi:hypothetical protein